MCFYTTKPNSTLLSNPIKIWNLQLASRFLQVRDENGTYASYITLNFHSSNASPPHWPRPRFSGNDQPPFHAGWPFTLVGHCSWYRRRSLLLAPSIRYQVGDCIDH